MTNGGWLPSLWGKTENAARRDEDHPLVGLRKEMDRLFDDFFRGFPSFPGEDRFAMFSPSVDVRSGDKELTVVAELPGLDEKDVEVLLTDDALTLRGEKKDEREEKKEGYWHAERTFGSFRRVIPLPPGVDTAKAEATFRKGVLTVVLPKAAAVSGQTKKIAIKAE